MHRPTQHPQQQHQQRKKLLYKLDSVVPVLGIPSENEYKNKSVANAKAIEALEKLERPTLANISMNMPRPGVMNNPQKEGGLNGNGNGTGPKEGGRGQRSNSRKYGQQQHHHHNRSTSSSTQSSHGNSTATNSASFPKSHGYPRGPAQHQAHHSHPIPAYRSVPSSSTILPNRDEFVFKLTPVDEEICRETANRHFRTQMSIVYDPMISQHIHHIAVVHDNLLREHSEFENANIAQARLKATVEWLRSRPIAEQEQYFSRNPHINWDIMNQL